MPKKKPSPPAPDHTHLDRDLDHLIRDLHRLQGELLMIAQAILDAQTRLTTAVLAVDAKVTDLLARPVADPNAATPAEQQTIADNLNASAAAVEVINART